MKYLNLIVEGSTEEAFVKGVLRDYFAALGIYLTPRKILTGQDKSTHRPVKGGMINYAKFKNDVFRWM